MSRVQGRTTGQVIAGLDLTGCTGVVTGATSGLGYETARALASASARVVVVGRDRWRTDSVLASLRAAVPGAVLFPLEMDLASLASVRAGAQRLLSALDRVDVLVNNAGVMFAPEGRTEDGFELQIGINHLGHFLFTRLLEPLLLSGAPARVVTLSSGGHRLGDVDLDDLLWQRRSYDKFAAYGASKTANILFTVELERRLRDRDVHAFAVHPGVVRTALRRFMDDADIAEMQRRSAALATPERPSPKLRRVDVDEGAATTVWAATSPELDGRGGLYLAECSISADAAPHAVDPVRADRLWELSERLVSR